jgi:hypothetical protein
MSPSGLGFEGRVTTRQILTSVLRVPPQWQNGITEKRLARAMRALGWQGPRKMRADGKTQRGYYRVIPDFDTR